jgi:hypothetical protein
MSKCYSGEKIQKNTPLQERSIWTTWIDVTLTDMKVFIAVILKMGMNL